MSRADPYASDPSCHTHLRSLTQKAQNSAATYANVIIPSNALLNKPRACCLLAREFLVVNNQTQHRVELRYNGVIQKAVPAFMSGINAGQKKLLENEYGSFKQFLGVQQKAHLGVALPVLQEPQDWGWLHLLDLPSREDIEAAAVTASQQQEHAAADEDSDDYDEDAAADADMQTLAGGAAGTSSGALERPRGMTVPAADAPVAPAGGGGGSTRHLFTSQSLPVQQQRFLTPPATAVAAAEGDPFTLAAATAKQQLAEARQQAQAYEAAYREAQRQVSELQEQVEQATTAVAEAEDRAAAVEADNSDLQEELAAAVARAAAAADSLEAATRERDGMVAATTVMQEKLAKIPALEQEVRQLQWYRNLENSLSAASSALSSHYNIICAELNSQMLAAQRFLQDEAVRVAGAVPPPPVQRQQDVDELQQERYLSHLLDDAVEDAVQRAAAAEAYADDLYAQLQQERYLTYLLTDQLEYAEERAAAAEAYADDLYARLKQQHSRKRKAYAAVDAGQQEHTPTHPTKLRSHLSCLHDA